MSGLRGSQRLIEGEYFLPGKKRTLGLSQSQETYNDEYNALTVTDVTSDVPSERERKTLTQCGRAYI